jgi:hypothetical protein
MVVALPVFGVVVFEDILRRLDPWFFICLCVAKIYGPPSFTVLTLKVPTKIRYKI